MIKCFLALDLKRNIPYNDIQKTVLLFRGFLKDGKRGETEMNGKKKFVLTAASVLAASLILAAAGCGEVKINTGEIRAEGETTIIQTPTKTVDEYTPEENAYVVAGRLKSLDFYRSEVKGEVVAGFLHYKQTIEDTHIKNGDESYTQAKSMSMLVNVGKQAFFKGGKVVMRDATDVKKDKWSDDFSVTTLEDYREKRGAEPTALSNYILNDETILNAELVSVSDGIYTCRYEIDPKKGTSRYAVKMMNYGGLKGVPEFENCTLELKFDENWIPVSLTTTDKYTVNFIGDMTCSSTMTETFYDIGTPTEIPSAELFREKLGDIPDEIVPGGEVNMEDGLAALTDAVTNTDLSGGIKLNGVFEASTAQNKLLSLPVDGWISFDLEKFASEGLNGAFRARLSAELLGLPVNFYYTGDGTLYVAVGSVRYKYPLSLPDEGTSFEKGLELLTAEKISRNGDTYTYRFLLDEALFLPVNQAISDFSEGLVGPAKELFSGFSLKEAGAVVSIHKPENQSGKIAAAELFADFSAATLSADTTVCEFTEALPSAEELATYLPADTEKLSANFSALLSFADRLSAFDWTAGMNLTVQLKSTLSFDVPVQIQILPEKLLSGDLLGAVRVYADFDVPLITLFGGPAVEIYFQNGILTTVDKKNGQVSESNLAGALGELLAEKLPGLVGGISGGGADEIVALLADAAMNSETTVSEAEDGTKTVQLNFSEKFNAVLSTAYAAIWDAVGNIDMGDMESLKPLLIGMFKFDVERSSFVSEYKDGRLQGFSLNLLNEPKNKKFILGVQMGDVMAEGEMDSRFDALSEAVAAYEEGAAVREAVDKLVSDGVLWLGDSYGAKLDEVDAMYDALSDAAKKTVTEYKKIAELKEDWLALRKPVDEFTALLDTLRGTPTEEDWARAETLFEAFDSRQKEYLGPYAEKEYLELLKSKEE